LNRILCVGWASAHQKIRLFQYDGLKPILLNYTLSINCDRTIKVRSFFILFQRKILTKTTALAQKYEGDCFLIYPKIFLRHKLSPYSIDFILCFSVGWASAHQKIRLFQYDGLKPILLKYTLSINCDRTIKVRSFFILFQRKILTKTTALAQKYEGDCFLIYPKIFLRHKLSPYSINFMLCFNSTIQTTRRDYDHTTH
ncbi:hypothetical protein CVP04_10585, partial [Caviibacterium pharyngocola]